MIKQTNVNLSATASVIALLCVSISACTTTDSFSSPTAIGNPSIVNREVSRLAPDLQCFVRSDSPSPFVLPSIYAFSSLRNGRISASAFERPDLARGVMEGSNNILRKARFMEYVRAITNNDVEAAALVASVRDQVDRCFRQNLSVSEGYMRQLRSVPPNSLVNSGSRVASAAQLLREFEVAVRAATRSIDLSRELYNNVIQELRRGRTTESVFSAAVAPRSPRRAPETSAVQNTSSTITPHARDPIHPPLHPSFPDSLDGRFNRIMNELDSRGLVGA